MDIDNFLIAPIVFTPPEKVFGDIKRLLLKSATDDELIKLQTRESSNRDWNRIVVLTERMEFIEHLDVIRETIIAKTGYKEIADKRTDFKCVWLNHDFAGMHKDLEALEIYLLVSAIDEIMQNDDFKDFYKWLMKEVKENNVNIKSQKELQELYGTYNSKYGMIQGVRRGFREFLDDEIKEEWTRSYYATKLMIKDNKIVSQTEVDSEKQDLLIHIADALLSCRNTFTHNASRQFECDQLFSERQSDEDIRGEASKNSKQKDMFCYERQKKVQRAL